MADYQTKDLAFSLHLASLDTKTDKDWNLIVACGATCTGTVRPVQVVGNMPTDQDNLKALRDALLNMLTVVNSKLVSL